MQLDGKELPHFLHRRKFEEAESGWYYSQRLKSVQVKYPNPKKDHEVMVSFEQFDLNWYVTRRKTRYKIEGGKQNDSKRLQRWQRLLCCAPG